MGTVLHFVCIALFTSTLATESSHYDPCTVCQPGEEPERSPNGICSCKPCPENTYKVQINDQQCTKCTVVDPCAEGMHLLYPCEVTKGDGKCSICENDKETKYAEVEEECLPCGGVCGEGHSSLHDCRRQGYQPGRDCEFNDLPTPTPTPESPGGGKTLVIGLIVGGVGLILVVVGAVLLKIKVRYSRPVEETTPESQIGLMGDEAAESTGEGEVPTEDSNDQDNGEGAVIIDGVSGEGNPSGVDAQGQREGQPGVGQQENSDDPQQPGAVGGADVTDQDSFGRQNPERRERNGNVAHGSRGRHVADVDDQREREGGIPEGQENINQLPDGTPESPTLEIPRTVIGQTEDRQAT